SIWATRASPAPPALVVGTSAVMSEPQSAPAARKSARETPDPADPAFVAKLQQAANLANENCDRATALAQKLSGQLRTAQDRINELENGADGLVDRLRAEVEAAIAKLKSDADARVERIKGEADERVASLEDEVEKGVAAAQAEAAQAKQDAEQAKAEA